MKKYRVILMATGFVGRFVVRAIANGLSALDVADIP
mgnify:CR=1 FL=1